jgi:dTDP-glucose 4,6-dehydratase
MWTGPSTGRATFIDTNVTGTYTLLEAARAYWMGGRPETFRFHHISTDEVYGSLGETGQFTETRPTRPQPLFGLQGGLRPPGARLARDLRPAGGADQLLEQLRPLPFPRKADPGGDPERAGGQADPGLREGENVRDWLYVEDHADALLLVVEKGALGRSYNIGGENERGTSTWCGRSAPSSTSCGPKARLHAGRSPSSTDRPGHDARYAIDPTRIRDELGWRPR